MRFADPLAVACPACGKEGRYSPRDLVALRSRCSHCSASLESAGLEMREGLSSWSGYLAKIDMAIELERVFGFEPSDDDLERIKIPFDFVQLIRDRAGEAGSSADIQSEVLAALTRSRKAAASPADLHIAFEQLFSVTTHP